MLIKQNTCHVKTPQDDESLGEGEFIAYPSTFTRTPDSYGDVVARGAFADTIKAWRESGNTMPVMYGHRMDDPDYNIGGVSDMGEDSHGWWIKGSLDMDSPKAAQVYRLLKAKRLSQLSFAYDVGEQGPVTVQGGGKANELRKVSVFEASFVPVGANQDTGVVGIKSAGANGPELRDIADALKQCAGMITDFLERDTPDPDGNKQQSDDAKAPDGPDVKTEEPHGAKAEEPKAADAGPALELAMDIALMGEESEV